MNATHMASQAAVRGARSRTRASASVQPLPLPSLSKTASILAVRRADFNNVQDGPGRTAPGVWLDLNRWRLQQGASQIKQAECGIRVGRATKSLTTPRMNA